MPLGWDELVPEIGPDHFTIGNAPARLTALAGDPWDGFRAAEAPIESRAPRKRRATSAARKR